MNIISLILSAIFCLLSVMSSQVDVLLQGALLLIALGLFIQSFFDTIND